MTHSDSWKPISARIRGLVDMSRSGLITAEDLFNSWKHVSDQCAQIADSLKGFAENFKLSLPPALQSRIVEAATSIQEHFKNTEGGSSGFIRYEVQYMLFQLAILETEVSFLLADTQASVKARSELAFFHLQRLIVVDTDVRRKWEAALKAGEVACEKLGAIHLLAHGIWAFKVTAEGERTDLVFQEPARDLERVAMFADGLVLTEWKKLKDGTDSDRTFAQARQQASDYTRGALAGSELRGYRFAVVVSRHVISPPKDFEENGVIWRHVNIAVSPETPSRRHRRGLGVDT